MTMNRIWTDDPDFADFSEEQRSQCERLANKIVDRIWKDHKRKLQASFVIGGLGALTDYEPEFAVELAREVCEEYSLGREHPFIDCLSRVHNARQAMDMVMHILRRAKEMRDSDDEDYSDPAWM